jgi:photosystem II stability/assembly factor-like uncharacterized protein
MSSLLLVGTRRGLFTFRREPGQAWRSESLSFLGDPVTAVLLDQRDESLHAGLNLGHFGVKLHRSQDLGQTWSERPLPTYPKRPARWVELDDRPGSKAPWTNLQIWALERGGESQPGVLWCGTIPGGLFRTNDGGANWSCDGRGMRADYMPPEHREKPSIQDPHRLVQCPSDPKHLWVQHHNGIFRSTDGGAQWQAITEAGPSTFGFAVAVHPRDPQTAWFVPAVKDECRVPVDGRFVVTRTRDGGRSFDVLDRGLPEAPIYDIVYRHALDVDTSGDVLAMGSTTGGLWTSDDAGDTWQALSEHLPPVYCVRLVEVGQARCESEQEAVITPSA